MPVFAKFKDFETFTTSDFSSILISFKFKQIKLFQNNVDISRNHHGPFT